MITLNLLPLQQKKELIYEKYRRLVVFSGVILFVQLLIFSILLLNVYFFLTIQMDGLNRIIEAEKLTVTAKKSQELEQDVKRLKQRFETMASLKDKIFAITPALENLSGLIPQGIQLKTISIKRDLMQIQLGGWASKRSDLLEFKSVLEASPEFSEINLPINLLLRQQDIDFNITFKLR